MDEKQFIKLEKLADSIYNTVIVIDFFCSTQRHIEELYNLTPVVKSLKKDADEMNSIFINIKNAMH